MVALFEGTLASLREVLNRVAAAGLRPKPSKCELFRKEVAFLGHLVGRQGTKPNPRKVEVIQQWPPPKNLHELRRFLGFASYYRKYVPSFSEIAAPLNALTKKEVPYIWSPECQKSFDTFKVALTSDIVLTLPREGYPVILDTDASDVAICRGFVSDN